MTFRHLHKGKVYYEHSFKQHSDTNKIRIVNLCLTLLILYLTWTVSYEI